MPYSYSTDQEHYHGTYETAAEAAQEALASGAKVVWVGENRPPIQPEDCWDVDDWLEHVSVQEDYSIDAAEGWEESTRWQRNELEAEVRKVMAAWLDRHGLRPKFWIIDDPQEMRAEEPTHPKGT